ncbi:molybdopterin-dependent oxidoreductase [Flavisolibacter ginsenosidimutans]|uniref:Molybdopterin-dependent oxidoreductase n=1 Tax=Flavisolibacter ginsenosidimutans TaxID=661481 RepID=A0A5B8UHF8_9BACT|nr:molybdopterin-dependent oxidoreductase [Flavisolibacter ginsenosidimutans]QEC55943.1 molybdopterin-dependent oxidoreductase [Flavisolibacter ginsenosidimutans]
MNNSTHTFPQEQLSKKQLRRKTLLSFLIFVVLGAGAWALFSSVKNAPKDDGASKPLRSVLSTNESIFSSVFSSKKLVKEYPVSAAAKAVRVNGSDGLEDAVDTADWRLHVVKQNGDTLTLTLADIKKLPKKDIVFDFKCIEGWSQVTHWAGVSLKTFLETYGLTAESKMNYVGLQTPNKKYYVGIDMPSAVQEQTILCYEMNGAQLPLNQGYPLRLIIPVKYGVKHLKRIGTMYFSNSKPPDFWAERGYDYYAGH